MGIWSRLLGQGNKGQPPRFVHQRGPRQTKVISRLPCRNWETCGNTGHVQSGDSLTLDSGRKHIDVKRNPDGLCGDCFVNKVEREHSLLCHQCGRRILPGDPVAVICDNRGHFLNYVHAAAQWPDGTKCGDSLGSAVGTWYPNGVQLMNHL